MKNLKFTLKLSMLAISILSITISCEKEEVEPTVANQPNLSETANNEKVLSFKNMDEFSEYMLLAQNMNTEERIALEQSKNFKSLATAADEFYSSIDFNNFSSKEEIIAFARENDNYLSLIENSAGEYTLETKLYNNPERFVLNEQSLVIIGDKAFKRFNNQLGYTDAHSLNLLTELNYNTVSERNIHPEMILQAASSSLKSASELSPITTIDTPPIVVGSYFDNETIDGSNKTYMEINDWQKLDYVGLVNGGTYPRIQYRTYILIQPLKKIFGIWCKVKRTISCDFKVRYDTYNNYGTYTERLYTYSNPGTLDYMIYKEFVPYSIVFGITNDIVRLRGIDCWGETPSTNRVYIQQNTVEI